MATTLKAADAGEKLKRLLPGCGYETLQKVMPCGSLQARRQSDGAVAFAWRVSIGPSGAQKQHRIPIGIYDAKLPPASLKPQAGRFSYQAAVRAAEAFAQEHRNNRDDGGLPGLRASERRARVANDEARLKAAEHTVQKLLETYADHLKAEGRDAYKDVRSILKHHVVASWPDLAGKPANQATPEDIADIMRQINSAGKLRTANKARSYIRAAFEMGKAARTDASVPGAFKAFSISSNPATETRVIKSGKRPVIKPLKANELRAYWKFINEVPGMRGAALRLHLLTGGQRLDQLVRLAPADIADDMSMITIHDGKGKGGMLRPHPLPLLPLAAKALKECATLTGSWALTTDGGKTHIAGETLSEWAINAVAGRIENFQPKRIRSGVETLLAANRVDKETRGRLQSHGISGVQDTHYNAHDYIDEKRKALQLLLRLLEPSKTTARV